MKSYLIIDGYNLMHELAQQRGEFVHKDNLEDFRDRLILEISNYAALAGSDTVLVFDALNRSEELSEERISGITVVFTGKDETADTYIERYLYTRPRNTLVYLVTSDAAIQEMANLTGAQRISSRQFITEINDRVKEHEHFGTQDKDKHVNQLGEHLQEDALKLFETLRHGKNE